MDRLTKSAHFLAVLMTFSLERFCWLYIHEIVRLHGVPISIVSDRDPRFMAHFWKSFQKAMGTRLTMSTTFHPKPDGQSERTIQVLDDMLRACILDHKGSWEEHLPLVEFAYNNSYQASIQMAPYEALYGRPCRSPLCWTEVGESSITGPDLIRDTSEKVSLIRQRLLTDQSRQKSYADVRRQPLEFEVGDHVLLKVMPKRRVVWFGKRGKLSPRFIGPFEILERVGTFATGWRYRPACQVFTRYFTSPCSGSILQIQLMWWIGDRLRLTLMGPLRRDQYVFWIAVIRFCDARP